MTRSNAKLFLINGITLYGNCKSGRRPDFFKAEVPEKAEKIYEAFVQEVKALIPKVQIGIFGAYMQVHLINRPLPKPAFKEKCDDFSKDSISCESTYSNDIGDSQEMESFEKARIFPEMGFQKRSNDGPVTFLIDFPDDAVL